MNRNYGIDLLKAMAMLMVVTHHVMMTMTATEGPAVLAFHVLCYCAVDCFVMATGFIMFQKELRVEGCGLRVDRDGARPWKWQRIVRLWRQVVGYSLALTALAAATGWAHVGWRTWAAAVMPVTFDCYWFFTQYAALFFAMPYLNLLMRHLSDREAVKMLGIGFVLLSCASVWAGHDLFAVKWGYTFIWFIYLYLAGSTLSRGGVRNYLSPKISAALIIGGVALATGGSIVGTILTAHFGCGARLGNLTWDYASPAIFAEAVGMVTLFTHIRITNTRLQRFIGFIAPSTFIVYVVHSNNVFREMVGWKHLFSCLDGRHPLIVIVGSAAFAFSIYVAIVGIDSIRRLVVKRLWVEG